MAEEVKEKVTEEPTLTSEEQMEALKTQLGEANEATKQAQALAEEKEKGFKSLQRQLSEKKVIPQSSLPQAQATQELISAIENQVREAGDTMSPTTQAKLNAARQQLAAIEQQAAYEKQAAITLGVAADLRNELIDADIDPDDSKCDGVWDAIQIAKMSDGNFDNAKKRTSRIIKNIKKEEPKKEEPSDDAVQVAARKILEKEGKLKTHEGTISGGGGSIPTDTEKFAAWVGGLTPEEFAKRKDDINAAYRNLK